MKPESLLHLLSHPQKCTTGCPALDHFLSGGIPCNSITELVAESGVGKTQLCLQLLLSAQLPTSHGGLAASSLYIHSEFPFPLRRLHHFSLSFQSTHPNLFNHNPLDRVFVHPLQSAHHLFDVLLKLDTVLQHPETQFPIRVVVIDSIAALFRSEFDNNAADLKRRSCLFFKISAKLKAQARRFGLAVVVTNQVVDFVGGNEGINGLKIGNLSSLNSSGRRVCPALGISWANCVNSRLFLSRNDEIVGEESCLVDESGGDFLCRRIRRRIHVVFAPHLPESSCEFEIRREGVFGVDGS